MPPQRLVPIRLFKLQHPSFKSNTTTQIKHIFTSEKANATASFVLSSLVWIQNGAQKNKHEPLSNGNIMTVFQRTCHETRHFNICFSKKEKTSVFYGHWYRHTPRTNPEVQYAFKISMTHWIRQFALRIAVRSVLHRCASLDIHCWKLYFVKSMNFHSCNTISNQNYKRGSSLYIGGSASRTTFAQPY